MPEDVKLSSYVPAKDCKTDYCSPVDDSHPESSIYADHSDREMSRSETSSCSDESSCYKQVIYEHYDKLNQLYKYKFSSNTFLNKYNPKNYLVRAAVLHISNKFK